MNAPSLYPSGPLAKGIALARRLGGKASALEGPYADYIFHSFNDG